MPKVTGHILRLKRTREKTAPTDRPGGGGGASMELEVEVEMQEDVE